MCRVIPRLSVTSLCPDFGFLRRRGGGQQLVRILRRGGGDEGEVAVGAAPVAVGGGLHRADEGRADLRLPVEEEVARPVGQAAVCHQRLSPAGTNPYENQSCSHFMYKYTH